MMHKTKAVIATGAAVLVVGSGVGVASAATNGSDTAQTSSSSPSASGSKQQQKQGKQHKQHKRKGLLARTQHGQLTLGGKKHRVVDVQRGEVEAVTAHSVTLRSKDGYTHRYAVDGDSKVREKKEKSSIGKVAKGDRVRVVADHSDSTVNRLADHGKHKS